MFKKMNVSDIIIIVEI